MDSLSADLFSELDELETLYLVHNDLDELPDGIFNGLSSLETVGLWRNQLDDLPAGVFNDLSDLKSLTLHENQLDDLPDGFFNGWNSLERLTLHDNPGAPFVFSLKVEPEDADTIVVNASNSTPFDISLTLEAFGGSLASSEVTLPAGSASTDGIDVTPNGNGAMTVRVVSAEFDAKYSTGTAVGRGDPLTLPNAQYVNNPATGRPTISGTAQVGETLTASTTTITDQDGTTNATFEYQWISSDGTTDRDIEGATASSYTITASDLEQTIKVMVKFADDAANHEMVTSAATDSVVAALNFPATGRPVIAGNPIIRRNTLRHETLTVDLSGISDQNGLPEHVQFTWICIDEDYEGRCRSGNPWQASYQLVWTMRWQTIKVQVSFVDNGGNLETLVSEPVGPVVYVNSPAKGAPTMRGIIPRVGERLRAETHGIRDANGITRNPNFSRQWFANGAEIQGATDYWYTIQSTDVGKRIKFSLAFTDDDGWPEELESAPTSIVVATDSVNSPATGAPLIRGSFTVCRTLTAATDRDSRISDSDGLTDPTYAYQWIRSDGTTDTDISGATTATYTLVTADAGKSLKVRVSFDDDNGNQEVLISAPSTPVSPAPTPSPENNPAQGTVVINGAARVGETLTADTSGITDPDGMDNASFNFNWFVDYDAEANGGNLVAMFFSRYTVRPAVVGKEITAVWSFVDDLGNRESGYVTTAIVEAAAPGEPRAVRVELGGTGELDATWVQPDSDGGSEITGYKVQWKEASGSWDTAADVSEATTTDTSYTITGLSLQVEYAVRVIATNSIGDGPASEEVKVTADAQTSQQMDVSENAPATGAPAIIGILEVGHSLNADTSNIADADGLDNAAYAYQWVAGDTNTSGATGSTYTLTAAEQGKAIKVRVSFTDDGGNEETLTSEALVVPIRPYGLTAAISDGDVALTWNPPVGFPFHYDYQIIRNRPELGENDSPVYVDTGNAETIYTDTDVESGVLYVYRVRGANYFARFTEWSEPAEIRTAVVNAPATGLPTISGTVRVNQTLTADTSSVSDVDGLDSVSYSYQWLADDAAISGATDQGHTLTRDQEGKAIKVRVSFADDAENEETLTSTATVPVAPKVPDAPTNLTGVENDNGSITITWNAPENDTVTGYQILRRRPRENEPKLLIHVENTSNASTAYTDTDVEQNTLYVYRVKAINGSGTGPQSNYVNIERTLSLPAAPTDLTASANGDGHVALSWTAPDDDSVTGYRILRRRPRQDEDTLLTYVADTGSTATAHIDMDVEAGELYVYRVKAINAAGAGPRSNYVNIEP